jgi:hypothetical protein
MNVILNVPDECYSERTYVQSQIMLFIILSSAPVDIVRDFVDRFEGCVKIKDLQREMQVDEKAIPILILHIK